jgi:hypothetical protein
MKGKESQAIAYYAILRTYLEEVEMLHHFVGYLIPPLFFFLDKTSTLQFIKPYALWVWNYYARFIL